ncbi:MAG: aminotransferase class III-fold pyridoxal phosphate-dependent enzyme, partial [Hafnia sp.]
IAKQYTGGTGVIITRFAYHGVTGDIAELSPSLGRGIVLPPHVRTVRAPDAYRLGAENVASTFAADVRAAIDDMKAHGIRPAAILLDGIFSSDGVLPGPAGFLADGIALAQAEGMLYIADEVQSGFARTGLNINNLGDPNKALGEFTRYGKSHSQENLMQVMAAAGFDPTDAAKIKSGELKSLVDSETKKSNITAAQVKEQENLLVTLGQLDAQFERIRQDIAIAFAPEVMSALKQFGDWIKDHHGDIIGFFRDAGESVKKLTESVGGANALLLLLAAGLRANPLVMAAIAATTAANAVDKANADAKNEGKDVGGYLYDQLHKEKSPFITWDSLKSFFGIDEPAQRAQSARRMQRSPGEIDDLLHGVMMTESSGNPMAYNTSSGAAGAYQFMPATARDMGLRVDSTVDERLDPEKSRAAASVYMRQLLKRYDGNVDNALRAYNWGMGNVDKWIANGSDISQLPKETREYTGKVYGNMGNARNYYATQGRMSDNRPYQLASSGGQPQIQNSTHINTVNVNSNPTTVDALTKSINQQASRASTNAAFSSSLRP